MVGVVGARVRDVVEDVLAVHAVALGDGEQALGTERPLGVDVEALALAALEVARKLHERPHESARCASRAPRGERRAHLAGDGELVADLTLARAELAVQLRDRARLDAACEEVLCVSLLRLEGLKEKGERDAPPRMLSRAFEPVVMVTRSARRAWLRDGETVSG